MYRIDLRRNILTLEWQGVPLTWEEPKILEARDGSSYKKNFNFTVDGKRVYGWVGVLAEGHRGRANAGFSIIHAGRVVRGWPNSWRPSSLYGQLQGSNDLINQRLVGEVHLDDFDVSHTKDDILWMGNQEEQVEEQLRVHCADYRNVAKESRKGKDDEGGPSEVETQAAIEELKKELESPEMVDAITVESVPPEQVIEESNKRLVETVTEREETFKANIDELIVKGYLDSDMSPNDPYIMVDSADSRMIPVVVNTVHPHWSQLKGADGVRNYLWHCTCDAIAEWQARQKVGRLDPNTIKTLKDRLLRIPFEVEMEAAEPGAE